MNLTSKTPSNVRISIKGNFSIETSGVLSVLDNVMNSRFIGLVKNLTLKKEFFKGSNKNSKNGHWAYCKQQRYLNHVDIFISTFDQM